MGPTFPKKKFDGLCKQLMDPHYLERVGLIAYTSAQGTHITEKGNFDGMHNQLKNHFKTKVPKKEIFDGTHIAKKEIF